MHSVERYTTKDMVIDDWSGVNDSNLNGLRVPFNDGFGDTSKFIKVVLSIPKLHTLLRNEYCPQYIFNNTIAQRRHLENFIKSHYLIYNTLKPEVEYYLLYIRLTGNLSETAELIDWDRIRSTLKFIYSWVEVNADDETLRDKVLDYYSGDPAPIVNLLLTEILQAKTGIFQNRCEYAFANLDPSKKEQKVDMDVAKRWTSSVKFNIGETYILRSETLDGAMIQELKFTLKHILWTYEDIPVNLLIMKRLEDCSHGLIFCLNKGDCKRLNIPYESGLEVWPMSANWEYGEEDFEAPDDEKTLDDFIKSSNNQIRCAQHQDNGSKKKPTTFKCIQEQKCSEQIEAAEMQKKQEEEYIKAKLIEGLQLFSNREAEELEAKKRIAWPSYYTNSAEQRLNKQLEEGLDAMLNNKWVYVGNGQYKNPMYVPKSYVDQCKKAGYYDYYYGEEEDEDDD